MVSNENVDHPATSTRAVQDTHLPDRRTPMNDLKHKTVHFVDDIWRAYVEANRTNLK